MTEQQAKQIREMREQGIGYRSIALTVGLSRDIVRNFCKSRGLSGYGSALTKNIREQVMLGKACLYCGSMRFPSREEVEKVRNEYPKGCRVVLERMDDMQAPPIGTEGTVRGVDDTGSIMVKWDNGSSLHVVYGEDRCRKI